MSDWIPGVKPLRKRFIGEGGHIYLAFAMKLLRDLYKNDAAVLQAIRHPKPGVTVLVQKLVVHDVITITADINGFFVSILFKTHVDFYGDVGATYYLRTTYKSRLIEKNWKQVGTTPGFAVENPQTYEDMRKVIPPVGSRNVLGLDGPVNESVLLPYKGAMMEFARKIYDQSYPVRSNDIDSPPRTEAYVTEDGLAYKTLELELSDAYSYDAQGGHQPLPIFREKNKGLYFVQAGSEMTERVTVYLCRFTDGENPEFIYTAIVSNAVYPHRPVIVNLTPDVVFGFLSFRNNGNPGFFFITRDAGTTVHRITGNGSQFLEGIRLQWIYGYYLDNDSAGYRMLALSDHEVLLVGGRLGPVDTWDDSRAVDVWRITIKDDNSIEDEIVLRIEPPFFSIQSHNLGGGCLLITNANNYNHNATTVTGHSSFRYLSFDNGRTWTTSQMGIPGAPDIHQGSFAYRVLNQVFPYRAYVSGLGGGAIYVMATTKFNDTTGDETDAIMYRSTDQAETWEELTTVAKRTEFPRFRTLGTDPTGTIGSFDVSEAQPRTLQIIAAGSKAIPYAIDLIHPYRCDDTFGRPANWFQQE